jgi:hypothetical protein
VILYIITTKAAVCTEYTEQYVSQDGSLSHQLGSSLAGEARDRKEEIAGKGEIQKKNRNQ